MTKDKIRDKASLSWTKEDYEVMGEEAPECVFFGKTEGELLEDESLEDWIADEVRTLSVIRDHYPEKFEAQYHYYVLDLEYLASLGKISAVELEKLKDKGNFNFGQE